MARKTKFKKGDYVRVNKTTVGVVAYEADQDACLKGSYPWWVRDNEVGVIWVDKDGYSAYDGFKPSKLTKVPAPQYVVVWSDTNVDPFTQFTTRAEANAFAAKLRKRKDIVEVRVYRLAK